MRLFAILFALAAICTIAPACGSSDDDASMDVSGELEHTIDIPAQEISTVTPVEKNYCVGIERDPLFSQYDGQCKDVMGQGECIQMPNPHLGNAYYCALCGLKGERMVCYMINAE